MDQEKFNRKESQNRNNLWKGELPSLALSKREIEKILIEVTSEEEPHESPSLSPIVISEESDKFDHYTATFAWKLAALTSRGGNPLSKQSQREKIFHWHRILLSALATSQYRRVLEMRIENDPAHLHSALKIYLIGHIHGSTEELASERGRQFRRDLQAVLSMASHFYQFAPLSGREEILSCAFCQKGNWMREVKLPSQSIPFQKNTEVQGFSPQNGSKPPSLSSLSIPAPLEKEEPSSLFQYLSCHPSFFRLRLLLTPTYLTASERQIYRTAREQWESRESCLPSSGNLPGREKENFSSEFIGTLLEEVPFLFRLLCLSSDPISLSTIRLLKQHFFGQLHSRDEKGHTSTQERNRLYTTSYPFPPGNNRQRFLTTAPYLGRLFHLPLNDSENLPLEYKKAASFKVPDKLSPDGIELGIKGAGPDGTSIKIAPQDFSRHLYLLGQTGTGKSTLMLNMIQQELAAGKGLAVIDPHGDLCARVRDLVPWDRQGDLIEFAPASPDNSHHFNPLEVKPVQREVQKSLIVDQLMEIFDQLYDLERTGGPIFESYMRNALLVAIDSPEMTIVDVPRLLTDSSYRKRMLISCNDEHVVRFWKGEAVDAQYDSSLANMAPYVNSKLNNFVYNNLIREVVNKQKSSFSFRNIMDRGKIFLANLSKGQLGTRNANMLGMLLINRFYTAVLGRQDTPESQRRPFTMYIDEFQSFTTPSVAHIFAEARKYGLALVCANQNLYQLKEEIRKSVLGTVGNILSFRPGLEDAAHIERYFAPEFDGQDLLELPNYSVLARILVKNHPASPFQFQTLPLR